MMSLNKEQIKNIRFDVVKKGYSLEQVDGFIDTVATDWESLSGELQKSHEELENYRAIEKKLSNALVKAEETADNIVEEAKQKAAKIVAEAEAYSKKLASDVEAEEFAFREKCLKERDGYVSQARLLKDFTEEYKTRIRADMAVFAQKFDTVYSFDAGIAENNPAVMKVLDDAEKTKEPEHMDAAEKPVEKAEATAEAPEKAAEKPETEETADDSGIAFRYEPVYDDAADKADADLETAAEPAPAAEEKAAESSDEAKKAGFDMNDIMKNLPESDDELKAMIDEIL